MPVNQEHMKNVGAELVEMFYALRDGVSFDDVAIAQKLVVAMIACVDDIQADADSAILWALAGASESLAIKRADEM